MFGKKINSEKILGSYESVGKNRILLKNSGISSQTEAPVTLSQNY